MPPSNADIYATLLYAPCEGLPLWNPSPLSLGDVGFLRDGSFHVLYNAISGPPATDTLSDASRPDLAMRTSMSGAAGSPGGSAGNVGESRKISTASLLSTGSIRSEEGARPGTIPISPPPPPSRGTRGTNAEQMDAARAMSPPTSPPAPPAASLPMSTSNSSPGQSAYPRRSSLTLSRNLLRRSASPPAPGNSSNVAAAMSQPGWGMLDRRSPPAGFGPDSSAQPPDELRPPLPLAVEQETPRVFTMGPRASNNMRGLGMELGANVTGSPVGGTINFETSGGDGALLIPRDPVERTLLKHVGVLKAYVKAHRRWIFAAYGEAEDMDVDEIALIYGQDRTTDWGVSVSRDAAHGTKLAFEVFSAGKAGVWGNWKESCTASQRGPYRDGSQYEDLVAKEHARRGSTPSTAVGDAKQAQAPAANGITTRSQAAAAKAAAAIGGSSGGGVGAIVPMDVDADIGDNHIGFSIGAQGQQEATPAADNNAHGADALQENLGYGSQWDWKKDNPFPRDQSIILRRITAKNRLGLGFLPARMRASAGPSREGSRDRKLPESTTPLRTNDSATTENLDLLDLLHEIVLQSCAQAQTSIVSDDDCLRLVTKIRAEHCQHPAPQDVRTLFRRAARRWLDVVCDDEGFAQVSIRAQPRQAVLQIRLPKQLIDASVRQMKYLAHIATLQYHVHRTQLQEHNKSGLFRNEHQDKAGSARLRRRSR